MGEVEKELDREFWSIVLLMWSSVLAHFNDLVNQDTPEKSNAARKALLACRAIFAKLNIIRGIQTKHTQPTMVDQKKNRENRKSKFSKGTRVNREHVLHLKDAEQGYFPVAYHGDHPNSESGTSVSANKIIRQEEECRLETDLKVEERKAGETLQYQRQIDNEAKLEQLGEQNKKGCGTIPAKLAERVPVLYFGREPVKLGKKVPVVYNGRIPVTVGETVPIVYSKPSNAGGPVTQSGVRYFNSWKSTDISCSHPNQYVELDDPDVSQRTRIRHTMIIRSEGQIHRPDKDAPPSPPPPADATGPSTAVGASTSSSQPRSSPSAPPQQPWTIQTGFTEVMEQIASLRAYVDQRMTTLDHRLHDLQDRIDTLCRVAQFNP